MKVKKFLILFFTVINIFCINASKVYHEQNEKINNLLNNKANFTEEKQVELKLKSNRLWILFLIIFLLSLACAGFYVFWDCIKETEAAAENGNAVPLNEDDENIDVFKKKDCKCGTCCKYCSEDIMYGITFIGRLIMTLYSFQALFFLYNFIINFIVLLPGMLFFTDFLFIQVLSLIFYGFFAALCSNILIIPTYELLTFSFIRNKNILAHLESLRISINIIHDNSHKNDKIEFKESYLSIDCLLILIEICYSIFFISGLFSKFLFFKDLTRVVIYFIIYVYYLIIFFGYVFVALDLKIKLMIKIKEKYNCNCLDYIKINYLYMDEIINDFFDSRPPLPKINLLCYSINPILKKSYEYIEEINGANDKNDCFNGTKKLLTCKLDCCLNEFNCCGCERCKCFCCSCECCKCFCCCCFCCSSCCSSFKTFRCRQCFYTFKNIIRAVSFIIILGTFIYILIEQNPEWYAYVFLPIFFAFFYFLSTMLNFPYIIRNKKLFFFLSTKYKYKREYNLKHPIIIGIIRLAAFLIILLVAGGLIYVFFKMDEVNNLEKIQNFEFEPISESKDKDKLKPNICYSSLHDMNINLFLPFINDAYYFDDHPAIGPNFHSSFQIKGYKGLFFNETLYNIEGIENLIKSNDINKVKMIKYDVTIKEEDQEGHLDIDNEMTILAIKGTTNKKDIFLDLQLYLPSVLLTFLSYFSLLSQQKDSWSFLFLEYSLSLPYRIFGQYLIIDGYLRDLLKAYNDNKSKFKKNVIIVGHSLGGGLSKILGRFLGKQAISLSGPGVNAFHTLWEYEGSSNDFEISAIDLVPDMDLVPRVEISGGTIYRIICKKGPFSCHGKELSLCEVLIMCRNPNYEQYCTKMAEIDKEQIEEIMKSSEL